MHTRSLLPFLAVVTLFTLSACATTSQKTADSSTPAAAPAATPSATMGEMLPMTNDEPALLNAVAAHLQEAGLKSRMIENPQGPRLVLAFDIRGEKFHILIDTDTSSKNGSERVILIRLRSGLYAAPAELGDLLTVLNKRTSTSWAGAFFVDPKDGELMGVWGINMPEIAIPAPLVSDAVQRLAGSYLDLLKAVRENGVELVADTPRENI